MRTSTVFTLRAINLNQLAIGPPVRQASHKVLSRSGQTYSLRFGWLESLEVLINVDTGTLRATARQKA